MPEAARTLGVVLAGGESRRFGSDKALADVGGIPWIDKAVYQLSDWFDDYVIVGREMGPAQCIPDWPEPHMGPLGGIAGALKYAAEQGFETILTIPVDAVVLPKNLPELLVAAPSFVRDAPTIAHWPVSALAEIEVILAGAGKHSLRALVEATNARGVQLPIKVPNINTPEDLASLKERLARKPE